MCTAVSYHTKDHYFGRNLDFECSYGESVTITPRRFLFSLPEGAECHDWHGARCRGNAVIL